MNKHFNPAISEEKFAAWLDGMLPQGEMMQVGVMVKNTPELKDCAEISASIELGIQNYMSDDFLYQTDMEMLENIDLEIPVIKSLDYENDDKPNINAEKDDVYNEDLSSNLSMQSRDTFSEENYEQENKYIEESLEEETSVINANDNLTATDDSSTLSTDISFDLACE